MSEYVLILLVIPMQTGNETIVYCGLGKYIQVAHCTISFYKTKS